MKLKTTLFLSCFFIYSFISAQIEKKNFPFGILTDNNNENIAFRDLSWDKNGRASFINSKTLAKESLYDNSIKEIRETTEDNPDYMKTAGIFPVDKNAKPKGILVDYPEGIYNTKQDFIAKAPSGTPKLSKVRYFGFTHPIVDDSEHQANFVNQEDGTKIKNIFAIVYHNTLYFNIAAILDNRNEKDGSQTSDFPNSFVKAIIGGENYIYTETNLANVWEKGLGYGIGGGVGNGIAQSSIHGKGIVWDIKKQEFNIFRNCKDYNEFIKDILPSVVQRCDTSQPDPGQVRDAIEKIK